MFSAFSDFHEEETSVSHLYLLGAHWKETRSYPSSPRNQTDINVCVFFFFLVFFHYLFDWDFGNLKRFRGAYSSILKTHCIGGHFRNLALGRKNFKGTNLNFFEKCFWNESQYVCAENKLGENPLEFYLTF